MPAGHHDQAQKLFSREYQADPGYAPILFAVDVAALLKAPRMSPLITITGLSEITGLAVQTIYNRHCNGGDLPTVIKLGKLIRFRAADVENWINSKVVCPQQAPDKPYVAKRIGRPTKAEQIARRLMH